MMQEALCSRRRLSLCALSLVTRFLSASLLALGICAGNAQDATGALEGSLTDKSGTPVANATVQLKNLETNAVRSQTTGTDGLYRLVQLPVGHYAFSVDAPGFAHFSQAPVDITVSQTKRIDVPLVLASVKESVEVTATIASIDTSTNTLGKVVESREVLDLPLNGRNFAQLGLLQTGVSPLPAGLATQGGSLRSGQSYAVNGQRPEANNFLLDGVRNVNRMDGGSLSRSQLTQLQNFEF